MFFKAGAYTGNNTSPEPETDFDKVIFYALDVSHNPPPADGPALTIKAAEPEAPAEEVVAATAGVVVDDSFADGDRSNSADEMDTNWWTTSTSSAIEVEAGKLGLVSGSSGRGIRATFPPLELQDGQTLKVTYDFVTPATIGTDRDAALRVGLFDKLGRAELEADLSASSKSPNPLYDGLPGYMIDYDVGMSDAAASNIGVRKHKVDEQGRLLGTTKGYQGLAEGGDSYAFEPETAYTGTIMVKKVGGNVEITGALAQDGTTLTEFTTVDEGSDVNTFGMLGFHVNSKTFGSSKAPGEADNGIDFTNVKIEVLE